MSSASLMEITRQMLKDSKKSLPEIYKESGIPFYWLRKFASGEIKNPSVNRVQRLYEYLSGTSLI